MLLGLVTSTAARPDELSFANLLRAFRLTADELTASDSTFILINKFLSGLKADKYSPRVSTCSTSTSTMVNDFNKTGQIWNDETLLFENKFFHTTGVLSNSFADFVGECYLMGYDIVVYSTNKINLFGDTNNILQAFLQNLIGNIITFNNIYQNIVSASDGGNIPEFYFQVGRLVGIIIDFDPIELLMLFSAQSELPTEDAELLKFSQNFIRPVVEATTSFMKLPNKSFLNVQMTPAEEYPEFLIGSDRSVGQTPTTNDFEKAYFFIYGFANETIGTSSPNSTICAGNITGFIENF